MSKESFRKYLSMPGLLRELRECFDRVPDLIVSRGITLSDCLMTGLAIFCLKIPSMLNGMRPAHFRDLTERSMCFANLEK